MKQDIDNYCGDSDVEYKKNFIEHKVEVKQEFENVIEDHTIEIPSNHNEDSAHINYENFKCKNEEVDLKIECDNNDDYNCDQSVYLHGNVDVASSDDSHTNSYNNEKEHSVKIESYNCVKCYFDKATMAIKKCKGCRPKRSTSGDKLKRVMKVHIPDLKCSYCSKKFIRKRSLDHHLLKIHNHKDIKSKVYNCDKGGLITTQKRDSLHHNIKHGIKVDSQIFKCQQCKYKTYKYSKLLDHTKKHICDQDNPNEDKGHISYEDFKCKSEEVEKMEYDDYDHDQPVYPHENVDVVSSGDSQANSEEEHQGVNSQGMNYSMKIENYNCPKCCYDKITMEIKKCRNCGAKRNMNYNNLKCDMKSYFNMANTDLSEIFTGSPFQAIFHQLMNVSHSNAEIFSLLNAQNQKIETCLSQIEYLQEENDILHTKVNDLENKCLQYNVGQNCKREITGNHNKDTGHISYENFKCKNEEVDLKIEYDDWQ